MGFIADKPGWMSTEVSSAQFMKSSAHSVQHTNNNKWQYIVELLEDSLMTTK